MSGFVCTLWTTKSAIFICAATMANAGHYGISKYFAFAFNKEVGFKSNTSHQICYSVATIACDIV